MVISVREMRVLEVNCIGLGIPLRMFMEAAGLHVARVVEEKLGGREGVEIAVMVGKGGNGGDGLVAARYLASRGYRVYVLPAYDPGLISHPDAIANIEIVKRLDSVKVLKPGRYDVLGSVDVVIDGLLGTGVKGELREPIRSLVEEANKSSADLKVAIDTPTGLNPDTGEVHGVVFKADVTVTFHDVKPGLLKRPDLVGEIVVANIGIPREAWLYVGPGDALHRVPRKPRDAHKGMGGRVLVVGGSRYYTGAPALAGLAALACSADLSFVVVPEEVRDVIAGYSPELITATVPGDHFKPGDIELIEKYIKVFRPHVIVFGNGIGREPSTLEFAERFIKWVIEKGYYLVIDADGLKGIVYGETKLGWKVIITPHRGEFKSLTNTSLSGDIDSDLEKIMNSSNVLESTILLKAPVDIIVSGDKYRLNKTGNEAMTIGGTGDVLAGIAGAMLAKTGSPFEAAAVAAYLNGLAGDHIYYTTGDIPSPTKIVEVLPSIMKDIVNAHLATYNIDLEY